MSLKTIIQSNKKIGYIRFVGSDNIPYQNVRSDPRDNLE